MRRRALVALIAGAAVARPLAARGQPQARIGFLHSETASGYAHLIGPLLESLANAAFVDGQTVAIEYCWADGKLDRLPELAAELVRHRPQVIFTGGGVITVRAGFRWRCTDCKTEPLPSANTA